MTPRGEGGRDPAGAIRFPSPSCSEAERLRIVAGSCALEVSEPVVARRNDVNVNLHFAWWRHNSRSNQVDSIVSAGGTLSRCGKIAKVE